MADRKEWQVMVDGQPKRKGSKAVMIAAYEALAAKARAYELASGTKVELVETCGDEAKVLRSLVAKTREEETAHRVAYVEKRLADRIGALAEVEKQFAEYAAKYGVADALEWRSDKVFEAAGAHVVYATLGERKTETTTMVEALVEVAQHFESDLLRRSNWIPSCTNAFDNAGRAYKCKGQAEASRELREWAALILVQES